MPRDPLPPRRPSLTSTVVWDSHGFTVTVGYHPATGRLAEVFYADGQRSGTDLAHVISDACVIVSVALQHGITLAELGHSLGCVPGRTGPRPASILGALVAHIRTLQLEDHP